MEFESLQTIVGIITAITIILIILMCMVSVEQIIRLIHRTARLKTMASLYLSLVLLYAIVYTCFEIMDPGKFNGIDTTYY